MTAFEKYLTFPYGDGDTDAEILQRQARDNWLEATHILMDANLRSATKEFMKPCSEADFIDVYCVMHETEFNEVFEGAPIP